MLYLSPLGYYGVLNVIPCFNTFIEMNVLPYGDTSLRGFCALSCLSSFQSHSCFQCISHPHTYEFVSFVQPGKQLLAVVVVDWDAHEVAFADKVGLWAGVAGIQHIGNTILSHQILRKIEMNMLMEMFYLAGYNNNNKLSLNVGDTVSDQMPTRFYLVEDVLLGAQVEVWQDAGGPYISHRQAGLGQAHR